MMLQNIEALIAINTVEPENAKIQLAINTLKARQGIALPMEAVDDAVFLVAKKQLVIKNSVLLMEAEGAVMKLTVQRLL